MKYNQLTPDERFTIAQLKKQGFHPAAIAEILGRHRSTICREIKRNSCTHDGAYRHSKAQEHSNGRRKRAASKRKRFSTEQIAIVKAHLRLDWSPEQISNTLKAEGTLSISHETIYQLVLKDKARGGALYKHLRTRWKKRRKRYGTHERRGQQPGKRHISERPEEVESRQTFGHWEIDTVLGKGDTHCIVTIVERKSRFTLIGKLKARTVAELNRRAMKLIKANLSKFSTITSDNGTEFHGFKDLEDATGVQFFFATPHHSWERGTNENTNGLIRQYLPKGQSMARINQRDCDTIAKKLNQRPRKCLGYKTPEAVLYGN